MSYLKRFCLLLAVLFMSASSADAQDLRNAGMVLLGRIESDGVLRDGRNVLLGRFERNGSIRNERGQLVGYVDADGVVRDKSRVLVGRINGDGTVRDHRNVLVGRIENGRVRYSSNVLIGYAQGVPLIQAAVYFFFNPFGR